ncbi:tRNA (guanosine(37)-N1)-methyltransferase TrmD [Desulfosediminicola flagellatus]|uniref:tRNA (guanosine(37)-N1)-methyltransferase TrmD n=1 Tax=Desulfosediminicola flagellatus TaxID=2569541 RepID=UPI0010AB902D|nr:tRNA (guanosine(37)-N1)-methyltransferase TrmD [Desulfosediminicola flagellatus]
MIFDVLTIFPDLLASPLNEGILRRARQSNFIDIHTTNIRDFATDKHSMTDDRPFGGGEGMVMKAEPLAAAVDKAREVNGAGKVILMSPQGRKFSQDIAQEFANENHLILVCGRYEGVDERFRATYVDEEISIGDYILTGGELAAMVIIDSVTRLLPGVLGCSDSADKDTFSRNMLKHPQYTRPRVWNDLEVPAELLSGNHEQIEKIRFLASVQRTLERRPEMIRTETFSKSEKKLLKQHKLYDTILDIQTDLDKVSRGKK